MKNVSAPITTFVLLACSLFFATGTFLFAAVLPVYYLPISAAIFVVGALVCLLQPVTLPRHTLPLAILFVLGWGWAGIQALPLPASLGALIHPVWQSAQNILGTMHPSLSLTPQDSQRIWLFGNAAAVLFLLAGYVATQGKATLLHKCVAGILTGFSLYGLVVYGTGNTHVLWLQKIYYKDSLTSTFINKNTYATAAGIGVFICLYLAFKYLPNIPSARTASAKQRLLVMYHTCLKRGWPWLFMAFINWLALVLTQSRAGMASTMLALVVWWVVVAFKTRGGRIFWLGFGSLAVILLLLILSLTGKNLANRLESMSSAVEYRDSMNQTTLAIWENNPVLGNGLSSYNSNYRIFNQLSPLVRIRMEQAHNTWLQTLTELGTPAALALFGAIGWLAYRLVRTVSRTRTRHMAPATGLAILVLAGTHAWADFSANIPAILLLLAVSLGTVWGQKDKTDTTRLVLTVPMRGVAVVMLVALAALTAWQYPGVLAEQKAHNVLSAKTPSVAALQTLRPQLAQAIHKHPTAMLFAQMARTDFLLATPSQNKLLQFSSLNFTNLSLSRAPADPYLWHQRAMLQKELGDNEGAAASTIMSMVTGPAEGLLAAPRLEIIYRLWPQFSAEDQRFLTTYIHSIYNTHIGFTNRALHIPADAAAAAWLAERLGNQPPATPAP